MRSLWRLARLGQSWLRQGTTWLFVVVFAVDAVVDRIVWDLQRTCGPTIRRLIVRRVKGRLHYTWRTK